MGEINLFEPDFQENYDFDFDSQISLESDTEKSLKQTSQESKNRKTRAKWSKSEDELLQRYTKVYGRDWKKVSMFIHSKTPELIEKRWILKYDPSLKHTRWTREEDAQILRLYNKYGGKWIKIARKIPQRHSDAIKNRYYSVLRKRMSPDYPRPLSPPWEDATPITSQMKEESIQAIKHQIQFYEDKITDLNRQIEVLEKTPSLP